MITTTYAVNTGSSFYCFASKWSLVPCQNDERSPHCSLHPSTLDSFQINTVHRFCSWVARAVSLVDRTSNTEEMTFTHGQDESLSYFLSASLMSILSSPVVCGIYYWIILESYWALRPARWVIPKRIIATKGAKDLRKGRWPLKIKRLSRETIRFDLFQKPCGITNTARYMDRLLSAQ